MSEDQKRSADASLERADDDAPETKRSKPTTTNKKIGSLKCPNCGKTDFCISQALVSHMIHCGVAEGDARTLTLRPICLQFERERLSDFNLLVTDSIELVELTAAGMEQMRRSGRQRKPATGNVGIRCRYCAEQGRSPPSSETYPDTLQNLSHNVYNLTNRHLIKECRKIPESIRLRLIETKKVTTSQSMEKARLGLPAYLKLVTKELGLIDIGNRQGVRCTIADGEAVSEPANDEDALVAL
jgi:hypothetical protein